MSDYNVYAYNKPDDEVIPFIYDSLTKDHISRYLYSNIPNCDLNRLKDVTWQKMTEAEKKCWSHAHRLLDFKKGDWILHINVPEYGKVTAGRIVGEYTYQENPPSPWEDGRYTFAVEDVFTFDRNDPRVHPYLSSRLKLQHSLWQIYCVDEFARSLKLLREDKTQEVPDRIHLIQETSELIEKFTRCIQSNNPGKRLEHFMADVFRRIQGVTDVKENGSGWGTDYGADLIVTYKAGVISELETEQTLVVQIKSYEGEHWNTKAVDQLKTAIGKFDASMGLIITTGQRTEALEKAFDNLSKQIEGTPIYLMAGSEVAKFVMKYGMDVLLD